MTEMTEINKITIEEIQTFTHSLISQNFPFFIAK